MFHRAAFRWNLKFWSGIGAESQQAFAIGSGQAKWTFSKVHEARPACWCKKAECGRTYPACRGKNGCYSLRARFCLFNKNGWNLPRARFALHYTYSFLPFRSETETCQEQVSPRLPKMNFCPPAPCWGSRTPIPPGSISSHSFAEKTAKVFYKNDDGTDEKSAPSFLLFKLASVKNF